MSYDDWKTGGSHNTQLQQRKTDVTMHPSTFEYLKPTDAQATTMANARQAAKDYAEMMDKLLPDGPDKTYLLRKFREIAMWANVAITRLPDGTPRT